MRKLLTVIGCALLVASASQRMEAQDTREAQGTVTGVTASTLSIQVKDKIMTFNVDEKTQVTARGASTQTRMARAEGRDNPQLTELVKVGQGVDVRYREEGMRAESIRVLPGPVEGSISAPKEKMQTMSRSGTVSAIAGSSLTVKTGDEEMVIAIDKDTQVIGPGIGTAGRKKTEAGGKTVITDFVGVGDEVRVVYHEMGGAKTATEIHVTRKGTIKK